MIAKAKPSTTDRVSEIATLRIELRDSDPLIWREVEVPTSISLEVLHDIVQAVMGWEDYHLWEFTIAKQRYGLPSDEDEDWGSPPLRRCRRGPPARRAEAAQGPRSTTFMTSATAGSTGSRVTRVRQGEPGVAYPRYIGGERNAPPEDCGGISGFYDKLEAIADPKHPDHADIVEWMGEYDPEAIDEAAIKVALGDIAKRHNAAARRPKKKSAPSG